MTLKTESFIKAPDAFAVQTVEEKNILVDLGGFVKNSPEGEWIYYVSPECCKKSQLKTLCPNYFVVLISQ